MEKSILIKDVLPVNTFSAVLDELLFYSKWSLTNNYSSDPEGNYLWWTLTEEERNLPIFMKASSIIKLKILKHINMKIIIK